LLNSTRIVALAEATAAAELKTQVFGCMSLSHECISGRAGQKHVFYKFLGFLGFNVQRPDTQLQPRNSQRMSRT